MPRHGTAILIALALLGAAAIGVGTSGILRSETAISPDDTPCIRAELRSWVVIGWGRHLYLEILPTEGYEHLAGRVEFTSALLRDDYFPRRDQTGRPRIARMTIGEHLAPIMGVEPDDRLEHELLLTPSQARCLQKDRVYSAPYTLVTTNSSSGLRRAIESCGCAIPMRIASSGGVLGEFPGIDLSPGREIPADEWRRYGLRPSAERASAE